MCDSKVKVLICRNICVKIIYIYIYIYISGRGIGYVSRTDAVLNKSRLTNCKKSTL